VASGSDPGWPEILHIKTPAVDNALRPILRQLKDSPVATKLDQPAAVDGPQQTDTAGAVERMMAAATEQSERVPP
jgi:hypothetical protein